MTLIPTPEQQVAQSVCSRLAKGTRVELDAAGYVHITANCCRLDELRALIEVLSATLPLMESK